MEDYNQEGDAEVDPSDPSLDPPLEKEKTVSPPPTTGNSENSPYRECTLFSQCDHLILVSVIIFLSQCFLLTLNQFHGTVH